MKPSEALAKIPVEGFLKLTLEPAEIPPQTRSALIRKGNELLNAGKHDLALRIFLTAGYADGLVRLGEVYEKQGNVLEAFRMYWLAKYRKKIDPTVEKMAGVLRQWLGGPEGAGEPPGDR